jgi:hypothetical protein
LRKAAPRGERLSPGRRSRPKEVFKGPRLRVRVAPALRVRSAVVLALVSLVTGAAVAAALAAGIGFGVQALLHSVGTNF